MLEIEIKRPFKLSAFIHKSGSHQFLPHLPGVLSSEPPVDEGKDGTFRAPWPCILHAPSAEGQLLTSLPSQVLALGAPGTGLHISLEHGVNQLN